MCLGGLLWVIVQRNYQQPAGVCGKTAGDRLERRQGRMVVSGRPDKIGGTVNCDPARKAGIRILASLQNEERQPPIDMGPPTVSDRLPERSGVTEFRLERRRRFTDARFRQPSNLPAVSAQNRTNRRIA